MHCNRAARGQARPGWKYGKSTDVRQNNDLNGKYNAQFVPFSKVKMPLQTRKRHEKQYKKVIAHIN